MRRRLEELDLAQKCNTRANSLPQQHRQQQHFTEWIGADRLGETDLPSAALAIETSQYAAGSRPKDSVRREHGQAASAGVEGEWTCQYSDKSTVRIANVI